MCRELRCTLTEQQKNTDWWFSSVWTICVSPKFNLIIFAAECILGYVGRWKHGATYEGPDVSDATVQFESDSDTRCHSPAQLVKQFDSDQFDSDQFDSDQFDSDPRVRVQSQLPAHVLSSGSRLWNLWTSWGSTWDGTWFVFVTVQLLLSRLRGFFSWLIKVNTRRVKTFVSAACPTSRWLEHDLWTCAPPASCSCACFRFLCCSLFCGEFVTG